MERWVDFDVVTRDALMAALDELGVTPPAAVDLDDVARAFEDLPPADGAGEAVRALHGAGMTTGILTNASAGTVERAAARLGLPFEHRLSVDPARRFKPHPSVYQLAVAATGRPADQIGFVTANGWDAAGAGTFGFRVVWLRADPAATMPAVGAPEPIVATWPELPSLFAGTFD